MAVKQYAFWQRKRKGDNINEDGAHLNISLAARQLLAMFTVNAAAAVDADNRNALVHVGSITASLSRSQPVTRSTNLFLLEQNQKAAFHFLSGGDPWLDLCHVLPTNEGAATQVDRRFRNAASDQPKLLLVNKTGFPSGHPAGPEPHWLQLKVQRGQLFLTYDLCIGESFTHCP